MAVLIVERDQAFPTYIPEMEAECKVMPLEKYDGEGSALRKGTVFYVEDHLLDRMLEVLAKANPGCNVAVLKLERVGHCPAGDLAIKQVSKAGMLPS